jgi:(p)ppGpp synthase/HD superfamily hydrolase
MRARLARTLPASALARLDSAVEFAARQHRDQTRPAGEPYLEHLLETLDVLVEGVGLTDPDVLCAAVLHDVVEDTACTRAEVSERFGDRVVNLVDWVTKPEAADSDREHARAEYLARLRRAPADAILIKLADRLSNVQRLETHPRAAKQQSYYRETVAFIVPLADAHPWFRDWYARWAREYRGRR